MISRIPNVGVLSAGGRYNHFRIRSFLYPFGLQHNVSAVLESQKAVSDSETIDSDSETIVLDSEAAISDSRKFVSHSVFMNFTT